MHFPRHSSLHEYRTSHNTRITRCLETNQEELNPDWGSLDWEIQKAQEINRNPSNNNGKPSISQSGVVSLSLTGVFHVEFYGSLDVRHVLMRIVAVMRF